MTLVSPEHTVSNPERVETDAGAYYRWRERDGTPMRAPEVDGRPDAKNVSANALWTKGDELAWVEKGAKMKGSVIDLAGETWVVDVTCDGAPAGPRAERRVLDGLVVTRRGGEVVASYDGPDGRVSGRLLWNGRLIVDGSPCREVFPRERNPRSLPLTEEYREAVERLLARTGDEFDVDPAMTFDRLVKRAFVAERVLEESRVPLTLREGAHTTAADFLKEGEKHRPCVKVTLIRRAGGVWVVGSAQVKAAFPKADEARAWRVYAPKASVSHVPMAVRSTRLEAL